MAETWTYKTYGRAWWWKHLRATDPAPAIIPHSLLCSHEMGRGGPGFLGVGCGGMAGGGGGLAWVQHQYPPPPRPPYPESYKNECWQPPTSICMNEHT